MRDSWTRAWLAAFAVLVAAAALARSRHGTLIRAEEPVLEWLLDGTDTSRWDTAAAFGSPWLVYPGTLALALLALWFSQRVAIAIVGSLALGVIVSLITKAIVARPRPDLVFESDASSFPSLHVVQAGIFWGLLTLVVWWFGAPRLIVQILAEFAIVATLLTAIGRILGGQNWPSDVVGSAIIITLALITAALVFEADAPDKHRTASRSTAPQSV